VTEREWDADKQATPCISPGFRKRTERNAPPAVCGCSLREAAVGRHRNRGGALAAQPFAQHHAFFPRSRRTRLCATRRRGFAPRTQKRSGMGGLSARCWVGQRRQAAVDTGHDTDRRVTSPSMTTRTITVSGRPRHPAGPASLL
jgi:hypothetical protein